MKKYYENEDYNLAFDRWLNLMAELIIKHGSEVMEKLKRQNSDWCHVADYLVYLNERKCSGPGRNHYVVVEYYAPAA